MAKKVRVRLRISKASLILRLVVLVVLVNLAVLPAAFALGRLDIRERPRMITVEIQEGDTLWSLASTYGSSRRDVRQLVYEIRQINDVDALIYPGDILRIPTE